MRYATLFNLFVAAFLLFSWFPLHSQDKSVPKTGSLTIEVVPGRAQIFVDNRLAGRGSVTLESLRPGSYKIEARLAGYYSAARYVNLGAGESLEVELELELVVGYLELRSQPAEAEVVIGEERFAEFPVELPVGRYEVVVRAFGFEEVVRSVAIEPARTTTLDVSLEPAPFRVENLRLSKPRFNPANPGEVGITRIRFRVSAPGEGLLRIIGSDGTVLFSRPVGPFSTWKQEVVWNGSLPTGGDVSDGVYLVELEAVGKAGAVEKEQTVYRTARVTVDDRIRSRYRSLFSGGPGFLYAPLPEPVGPGNAQVTTEGLIYDADGAWRVPFSIGARFGVGVSSEIAFTFGPVINSRSDAGRVGGTVAFIRRYAYLGEAGALGLMVKGSVFSEAKGSLGGRDERTAPTGVTVGNPGALYLGPVTLSVTPEVHVGPDPVSYSDDPQTGPAVWGYVRGGASVEGEWFSLAVSTALRSAIFGETPTYDDPIALGGELNLGLPGTPLYISVILGGDLFTDQGRAVLKGGFGAGLLF